MREREPVRFDRDREAGFFARLFFAPRFGLGAFSSLVPPSSAGAAGGERVDGGGVDDAGGAISGEGGVDSGEGGVGSEGGGVVGVGGVGSDGGVGASPVTAATTSPTSSAQGLPGLKR